MRKATIKIKKILWYNVNKGNYPVKLCKILYLHQNQNNKATSLAYFCSIGAQKYQLKWVDDGCKFWWAEPQLPRHEHDSLRKTSKFHHVASIDVRHDTRDTSCGPQSLLKGKKILSFTMSYILLWERGSKYPPTTCGGGVLAPNCRKDSF